MTDRMLERILTPVEVNALIENADSLRNQLIIRFLYLSGLRVSEFTALKWRDLTLDEDLVRLLVRHGKGNKCRVVIMPLELIAAVRKMNESAGHECLSDDPVFISRKGAELSTTQVWRIIKKAADRAGIKEPVSCHWLRHSITSHSLDNGAPIHMVSRALGHSSLAVTSIYAHANERDSMAFYLG